MVKVGSFFAFQVAGNLLVLATNSMLACAASHMSYTSGRTLFQMSLFGISIFGTNLLCHRYLLEKAKAMSKM
jgi:hypothetical protein